MSSVMRSLLTHMLSSIAAIRMLFSPLKKGQRRSQGWRDSIFQHIAQIAMSIGSFLIIRWKICLSCEGLENVPRSGPVLITAHHFHHFYDGCILLGVMPRRLHIFVALDWIRRRRTRYVMEGVCALVGWPVALRSERLNRPEKVEGRKRSGAYAPNEARRYLLQAFIAATNQLRRGEALVLFPEAYPNIDPTFTPKQNNEVFLPFKSGFARIVEKAERDGRTCVAIIPVGLNYIYKERWQVTLRCGPALLRKDYPTEQQLIEALEEQVHRLSSLTQANIEQE